MRQLIVTVIFVGLMCAAESLKIGEQAPTVVLQGKTGGLVGKAGAWRSESLKGKIHVLFYVDPDQKDINEHVADAIKKKGFPGEQFGSVAVINMSATLLPNFILDRILAKKQKAFSRTVYVRDIGRNLVHHWGLADDSYDVVLFDENGVVQLVSKGEMPVEAVDRLIELIASGVERLKTTAAADPQ